MGMGNTLGRGGLFAMLAIAVAMALFMGAACSPQNPGATSGEAAASDSRFDAALSSALDYATDLALRRAIKSLDYKPTVVIVSQRTASVKGADKIVVLDEGRIVGTGTHAELMETCEVYKEIELSQTKGAKA